MGKATAEIPGHWHRDVRELAKVARDQGWRFDETGKGHPRFWPPAETGLQPERFSSPPSDHRAWRNFVQALVRKGLVVPAEEARKAKGKRKGKR